jgi:Uri superfamily endonuclease
VVTIVFKATNDSAKGLHWHIDHLLAVTDHVETFVRSETEETECQLHSVLAGGEVAVPRFGSSDCGCRSHLAWFRRKPGFRPMPWSEFVRQP